MHLWSDELEAAAHERSFLRPNRADLDELAAAIGYRDSDAGEVVWARAIAARRVPASFADDPERRFLDPALEPQPQPRDAYAALLFASDPQGLLDAEVHARELVSRFEAWGGPKACHVTWRLAHNPIDDPHLHPPSLGLLAPALARLRTVLTGGPNIAQRRFGHRRFQPIVDALTWSRRWPARARKYGTLAKLAELPNPFESWLSLSLTGYLFHGVSRGRAGEATIELAAPFPAPEWLDPKHEGGPRAVWSERLSDLRRACTRGDIGDLQRGLRLVRDDEPGQPRLIHFAAYGGPSALEQLAAAGRLELDARDADGRTALMLAAALPTKGPVGARKAEMAAPVNERLGAAACAWLLAAGTEPDARDQQGWTALHWAVALNRLRCVEALIAAKLDVDASDQRGRTPLMLAVQALSNTRESQVLDALLRAGADLARRDHHGWTVLHYLAANRQSTRDRSLAQRLVELGAQPSSDGTGRSPADVYAWHRQTAVDGGPFDPRTPVAAGPGLAQPTIEPHLAARLLDRLVPEQRDPAADTPVLTPALDDWHVWADWLGSRGDPRGELVIRELTMRDSGGSKPRRMQAELDALRHRAFGYTHLGLECADALAPVRASPIELEWTRGFVTAARVCSDQGGLTQQRVFEAARHLLELEPLLAELCLRVHGAPAWCELITNLAALSPQAGLRRLILEGLPAELPELDALPRVFPHVRSLYLIGDAELSRGHVCWPNLTHLSVRRGDGLGWGPGNVAFVFDMPQLTHLDLALSSSSDALRGAVATLAELGDVAHLRLSPLDRYLAAALLPCPLMARLRTLELSGVHGSALHTVVAHIDVLRGLERVRISVTPADASQYMHVIEQLRQTLPRLEFDRSGRNWAPFAAWR